MWDNTFAVFQLYEKDGSNYLEVGNSNKLDSGRYTVKATNSKGAAHSSADVSLQFLYLPPLDSES